MPLRIPLREQELDRVIGLPAVANDDLIVVDEVISQADPIVEALAIINGVQAQDDILDNPRNLVVTIVDVNASITAGTIEIIGTDIDDQVITESYSIVGNLVYTTTNIFKTVTTITVAGLTGNEGSDTIEVTAGGSGVLTIDAQPDVCRNLSVEITDGDTSITAGSVTITGSDYLDRTITEVVTFVVGTLTYATSKCFKTVTSAVFAGFAGVTGDDDTIIIGSGTLIGMKEDLWNVDALGDVYLGTKVTPQAVTTGKSTSGIDTADSTYTAAKTMWYKINPYKNKRIHGKTS